MINEDDILRFKKEKIKHDYIRRQRINELLLVHPQERKKENDFELAELLVDYPCFQNVAEEDFDQLVQLTKELYMECLLPDQMIIKQDDEPGCAYLIIQGHCSVYVTFRVQKFQKVKVKTIHMCDMGSRSIFGELSLLFKSKRTATVKSQEATHVIVIPDEAFNKYMRQPMLKKLNIIISFYKSLNFLDGLDNNKLLILASKTNITVLQSNTLVVRQGNKSKYIYFIKKGRVRILKNVEVINDPTLKITIDTYKILFKEPDQKQKLKGYSNNILLELTELGNYECFGEDWDALQNMLFTPLQLQQRPLPYSVISTMPLECYSIRKKDMYEYIDDVTRKQFLKYLRQYPSDKDLRRFYFEQMNWRDYRSYYVRENVKTPNQIRRDPKRMKEIKEEDKEIDKKQSEIILPKINKRQQNRQRIMGWNRINQQAQLEKVGITSRNRTLEKIGSEDPIDILGRMANYSLNVTVQQ